MGLPRSSRVTAAVLALCVGATAPVRAADADPTREARTLAKEGLAAFEDGRYEQAIASFERAYALAPRPLLLLNIAQAHRLAGDCRAALEAYLRYLRLEPDSAHREEVDRRAAEMQECIDQSRRPDTPAPPTDDGDGPRLGDRALDERGDPARPPHDEPLRWKPLVWGLFGGGVLGVGMGLYFGSRARDDARTVDEYLDRGGPWTEEYAAIEARGKRNETLAFVGLGLGLASAATAGLLLYLGEGEEPQVGATVAPGGDATLTWTARW